MNILVSPEELRGHSGTVTAHAAQTMDAIAQLRSSLASLQSSFQGQAAVRFDEVYNTWDTSANQMAAALDGLGRFLAGAADTVEGVDSELAAALNV